MPNDDIKGFEEFIEGENDEASFLPKPVGGTKREVSFEHFTFLINDSERLGRIKNLLTNKLPFSAKFEQGNKLLEEQKTEINLLKTKIFALSDTEDSAYRRSINEIFDSYFAQPKDQ